MHTPPQSQTRLDELLRTVALSDAPEAALAYVEAMPLATEAGRSGQLAAAFTARMLRRQVP